MLFYHVVFIEFFLFIYVSQNGTIKSKQVIFSLAKPSEEPTTNSKSQMKHFVSHHSIGFYFSCQFFEKVSTSQNLYVNFFENNFFKTSQLNLSSQENILLIANLFFLQNTDSAQSFNCLLVIRSKTCNFFLLTLIRLDFLKVVFSWEVNLISHPTTPAPLPPSYFKKNLSNINITLCNC